MKSSKRIIMIALLLAIVCSVCFFAVSCGKKYTVKYETNGGDAIVDAKLDEETVHTLPIPTKANYEFVGWYSNPEFSGEKVETYTVMADATFYAKWNQLFAITLNLDGGTLSASNLALTAGENVYAFMQNYVPVRTGLTFGGWFVNNVALAENTLMTSAGISLTAKYKVEYKIEVYKQSMDQTTYEKVAQDVVESDFVGTDLTPALTQEGFTEITHTNTVATKTLSATSSENVFRKYYDRNECEVTFWSNYPDSSLTDENKSQVVLYGNEITAPSDMYRCDGYFLAGWSTTPNGEVLYAAGAVEANNTPQATPQEGDKIAPTESVSLYAVWVKGLTDMFGGSDFIYLIDENSTEIYAYRGGYFFVGQYDSAAKSFKFYKDNVVDKDNLMFEGRIINDDFYCYYDGDREGVTYKNYIYGTGLSDAVSLKIDGFNGCTYSLSSGGLISTSDGTYIIDQTTGMFSATFTNGSMKDKTIVFIVGTVSTSNGTVPAFQVRNEDEYNMPELVRFAVYQNKMTYYVLYQIKLDGFGNARYASSADAYSMMTYKLEGDLLTLYSQGQVAGLLKIVEEDIDGTMVKGYKVYNEATDITYGVAPGATLELDGFFSGKYTNGTTVVEGYFTTMTSIISTGHSIVTLTDATSGVVYTFLTKTTTTTEGETQVVTRTFELKPNGYAEYYYASETSVHYTFMIILDDEVAGKANIYGIIDYGDAPDAPTTRDYVKIWTFDYVLDAATGLYSFTNPQAAQTSVEYKDTADIDLSTVVAFVTKFDTTATNYRLMYWYSSTTATGTTNYDVKYTATNSDTVVFVKCFAVYTTTTGTYVGLYATDEKTGITTITVGTSKLYIELNDTDNTFILYNHAPTNLYIVNQEGRYSQAEYIMLDGKGGAIYVKMDTNPDGSLKVDDNDEYIELERVAGRFVTTDRKTDFGSPIYSFASATKNFDFLWLSTSSAAVAMIYNAQFKQEFRAADNSLLMLDGYGFRASYIDKNGLTYEGMYTITTVVEDSNTSYYITLITAEDGNFYFDLVGENTMTVRGAEYGKVYMVIDNHYSNNYFFEFDGYQTLSVFKPKYDEDNNMELDKDGVAIREYIDEEGTYSFNGEVLTVTYKENASTIKTLVGRLDLYTSGENRYYAFFVTYEDAVSTYIDENDWSVLILDNMGGAVKYSKTGVKEIGSYVMITEDLLYYYNNEGSDACIYEYDATTGKVERQVYTAKGFYTSDLESLIFTKYGYAVFDATTRYYYSLDENANITVYQKDPTNANANKYGFVSENLGTYENIEEYNDKHYYQSSGFSLAFTRKAENKDLYPYIIKGETADTTYKFESLSFAPTGEVEFSSVGTVIMNNGTSTQSISCRVVREYDENDNLVMYFLVALTMGNLKFDIDLVYAGENEGGVVKSYYEVTGMQRVVTVESEAFYQMYYLYYSFLGVAIPNTWGMVSLVYDYNSAGVMSETAHMFGAFGANSKMYDLNGNIISIDGLVFTQNGSIFSASFVGEDNYTYNMHFVITLNSTFGVYSYTLVAFTREQVLTSGEYTLTVETIIASDSASAGGIYDLELKKGSTVIESDSILLLNDIIYIVDRTIVDEKVTASVYYKIILTSKELTPIVGKEDLELVAPYESVVVTSENMVVAYSADGKSFAEISPTTGVIYISLYDGTDTNAVLLVTESTFDDATSTYSITAYNTKTKATEYYTVKVVGGVATITKVAPPPTED